VCDPPYGLEFMGKEWDRLTRNAMSPQSAADQNWNAAHTAQDEPGTRSGMARRMRDRPDLGGSQKYAREMQSWHESWAIEAYRVLKPGGHLLAFGGTRTVHRLACAIEDAGFEIRDQVVWLYGSGFPKSLDVSKAIDKAAGAEREVVAKYARPDGTDRDYSDWQINSGEWKDGSGFDPSKRDITAPATPDAERWQGWGTALKPAHEPIIVARKPLIGTVAANVLTHGTGALNVDGCRIAYVNESPPDLEHWRNTSGGWKNTSTAGVVPNDNTKGRWPANVCLDEEAAAMLDAQSGTEVSRFFLNVAPDLPIDSGDELRFMYQAKASRSERNAGMGGPDGVADVNSHPT
jgi:hypothetical protein